ncbi:MAG: PEP-CTERM sorting domain-containing protein [candidate division Zixibacteria bacterium]|nr:PEP-CTERM sorting domain-containing protein [candidate division Zixibacteria bacterium]
MTIYQKTKQHPLKWIAALFIFLLVMGFTVDEVHGVNIPKTISGAEQPTAPVDQCNTDNGDFAPCPSDDPPPEIPEPATLILMGAGLGALHLARRRKKA